MLYCPLFGSFYDRKVVWEKNRDAGRERDSEYLRNTAFNISDFTFKCLLVFQVSLYALQQSSLELMKSDQF